MLLLQLKYAAFSFKDVKQRPNRHERKFIIYYCIKAAVPQSCSATISKKQAAQESALQLLLKRKLKQLSITYTLLRLHSSNYSAMLGRKKNIDDVHSRQTIVYGFRHVFAVDRHIAWGGGEEAKEIAAIKWFYEGDSMNGAANFIFSNFRLGRSIF